VKPPVLVAIAAAALAAVLFAVKLSTSSSEATPPPTAATPSPAGGPIRPTKPPGPDDPRPVVREPKSPQVSDEWKAEMTEKLRGTAAPGEAAFTAYSDRFIDENLELANEQAKAEGITLGEVRALTRLGLLVMATQRTPDVEEVLGRELSLDTKDELELMVQRENGTFKEQMRQLVAKKAPEEERWALIRAADARFREQFFEISGMTPALLDDMLAGNLLLPGAPGAKDPSTIERGPNSPDGPKDTIAPQPRPGGEPAR
jgi:hypothetical protein